MRKAKYIVCLLFFTQLTALSSPADSLIKTLPKQVKNKHGVFFKLFPAGDCPEKISGGTMPIHNNNLQGGCNTPTFFMRIKDGQGRKIELKELQTLPDGNFIAAGNVFLTASNSEGIVLKYSNDGVLLSQIQLKVANRPVSIFDMKITLHGKIIIAGTLNDGSNSLFISQLNESLTTEWTKLISISSPAAKLTLQLFEDKIALASQQSFSILYAVLNVDGSFVWSRQASVPDMISLAGFGEFNWAPLGLVVNCLRNGKNLLEILEIEKTTGNIISSHTAGDGTTENICLETTAFNAQAHLIGVVKKAVNDYRLVRYNTFGSATIETEHNYKISGTVDFNISGTMDNAGDALGFCLPQDGKMIFIKQFAYYQTTPEYTRQYDVPVGSSIKAISRSQDGGFLFGLNTVGSNEIILIKTDSIGVLAGCGYNDIPNDFHEIFNLQNTSVSRLGNPAALISVPSGSVTAMASINSLFDCNLAYCPPAPVTDTCLSTYYKTFRSGSYLESFSNYHLMRNNNHLVTAINYDRILGGQNQLTYGLNLLDEKGNFIKGITLTKDSTSPSFYTYKMTDSSIMMIQYFVKNGLGCYNYTLISDNLQIIWSKSVRTNGELISGSGFIFGGYHRDEEGNFYVIGTSLGFMGNPRISVYKMDPSGNEVWARSYAMAGGLFGSAVATSTSSALIIAVEASNPGGVTARIDKNTGQMLNSYVYQNRFNGGYSSRYLNFENDRILYFGNDSVDNILMGVFDTTGKPLKLKKIPGDVTVWRAGDFHAGNFYGTYYYFNGAINREVLTSIDTALNIRFMTEHDIDQSRLPAGIGVGDNGNVYVAGNYYYQGGNYGDAYIRKYNNKGTIGTCNFTTIAPVLQNINVSPVQLGFTEVPMSLTPETYSFNVVADTAGQSIANVLCSSVSVCDSINISGPDTVCQVNAPYVFRISKSDLCLLNAEMETDTTDYQVNSLTDSSAVITFKKTGNFWLKTFINTGCKIIKDSLEVHVSATPSFINLGRDTALCPGDSIVLYAGAGFSSYQWQDGSMGASFTVKDSGIYYTIVHNLCGEKFTDTLVVSLITVPLFGLPSPVAICKYDTVKVSNPPGFVSYNWQAATAIHHNTGGVFIVPLQDTWVSLAATTSEGCKKKDSFFITINPLPLIDLGKDSSFCPYDSVRLFAGNGLIDYLWNTGSSNAAVTVNAAGVYWVKITDNKGCIAVDSITLFHYPDPRLDLGADFNLCSGEEKKLDPGNFNQYLWQDNSASRYFTAAATGLYYVEITDSNHCKAKDSIRVLNIFPLPVDFLQSPDSICQYEKITLQADKIFISYLWSDNSSLASLVVNKAGSYALQVADQHGCIGKDTVQVFGKECFQGLYIPTAFTPNGDTKNDLFRARIYGYPVKFSLEVYNRYGELVFFTTDPLKGWDGMQKGRPAETGNYVWQCRYQFNTAVEKFEKGNVVLIRQ